VSRILDRHTGKGGQNGQLSKFPAILATDSPDELDAAKQSIITEYLGDHLLDPANPPHHHRPTPATTDPMRLGTPTHSGTPSKNLSSDYDFLQFL